MRGEGPAKTFFTLKRTSSKKIKGMGKKKGKDLFLSGKE